MNKKMIIIIAAVALVVIIGAGVAVFMMTRPPEEVVVTYHEYTFDEEYSNLADKESKKIVKYQVTIEYTDEEMLAVFDQNRTKIRNNIDEIMRATTSEDIEKTNGKERLRDRIKQM
ncbi:MAG TPA: flagellar basal body-associated FliL family protein, partial [Fusibacter sp.]|nr:flagellar basal body-associated FliL family protein [Fusibacter sp.]